MTAGLSAPAPQGIGALSGNAALVEPSSTGSRLELAAPLISGGGALLVSVDRENWLGPFRFGKDVRERIDAIAMIRSNFGGNLEMVIRVGSSLKLLWQASGRWFGPMNIPTPAVTGIPCIIQSTFGRRGNFELVAPLCTGHIGYFSRDNDDPRRPWTTALLGREPCEYSGGDRVSAVTMAQNESWLEVVARYGVDLDVYWSDSRLRNWKSSPARCFAGRSGAPGPTGNPVLVRRRASFPPCEVLIPWSSGGVAHFYRETADPCSSWIGPTIFLMELGVVDDISMIESEDNSGRLLLVARVADHLWFACRGSDLRWNLPCRVPATDDEKTRPPSGEANGGGGRA